MEIVLDASVAVRALLVGRETRIGRCVARVARESSCTLRTSSTPRWGACFGVGWSAGADRCGQSRQRLFVPLEQPRHRSLPARDVRRGAWTLRDNVTYYDALYVALAARLGYPLLTADARLARAPGLPCAVELIELTLLRHQPHRDRVDAVPQVRRRRVALALEHVPEMAVAVRAHHLHPPHAQRGVDPLDHRVARQRREERGPPAVRLELRVAAEQLRAAGAAGVDALGLGVGVLAHERALGAGLAQHLVLGGGQLGAPLGVALDDLRGALGLHAFQSRTVHSQVPTTNRSASYTT